MNDGQSTVYVVDDDTSVRKAVSRLFFTEGFKVLSFVSAEEFLNHTIEDGPGCAILDVQMPGISGIELQDRLSVQGMTLPVVFMTGKGDIPTSVKAIKSGAVDFLTKPVENAVLLETVQSAIETFREEDARRSELREFLERLDKLTARERQVMDHVVKGMLNKQIASQLGISEATVKVHRGRVMEKGGVDSIAELARMCERAGIC